MKLNSEKPLANLSITPERLHPQMLIDLESLYFRQSFLGDYTICPKMAYYNTVINSSTESLQFFAAFMGTAAHEVVFTMHEERRYNYTISELANMMQAFFDKALANSPTPPKVGVKYSSVQENFDDILPDYIDMLDGYQRHPRNHEFHSVLHEQNFTLIVNDKVTGENYLFTGTMDQAGYYDNGHFALRDLKFKDNNFRPSRAAFAIDMQMTIYTAALAAGYPSCVACKPRYVDNMETMVREVHYDGPCETCAAMVGTPKWPRRFVDLCELVWMRDFMIRKEDEYKEQYVIDNTQPKIPNPKGKGPPVYPRVINPKWLNGYKRGAYSGDCFIPTTRPPQRMKILMSDIIEICASIRRGVFYRRPGSHCSSWCKFQEQCSTEIKLLTNDSNSKEASAFSTQDPFA